MSKCKMYVTVESRSAQDGDHSYRSLQLLLESQTSPPCFGLKICDDAAHIYYLNARETANPADWTYVACYLRKTTPKHYGKHCFVTSWKTGTILSLRDGKTKQAF